MALKARTNLCRWSVLPATVTASGAPRDRPTTTPRHDDVHGGSRENGKSNDRSTTTPELDDVYGSSARSSDRSTTTRHLNDVFGGSTNNGGERRHLDDDPGAQRRVRQLDGERPGPATVRRRPGQLDVVRSDLRLISARSPRSGADPGVIPARSQQSSSIFS